MIRQGDILLVPVAAVPVGHIEQAGAVVLGLGEVTGHKHLLLDAVWMVAPGTDVNQFALDGSAPGLVFVVAGEQAELVHEEHEKLTVPAGVWQVVRQREYSPQSIRAVMD